MGTVLRCNMPERFLDEAKKLFELECGRASLPAVFGLYMLFFTSAMMGKDRAGLMYRYMVRPLPSTLKDRCVTGPENHPPDDESTGAAYAEAVATGAAF